MRTGLHRPVEHAQRGATCGGHSPPLHFQPSILHPLLSSLPDQPSLLPTSRFSTAGCPSPCLRQPWRPSGSTRRCGSSKKQRR